VTSFEPACRGGGQGGSAAVCRQWALGDQKPVQQFLHLLAKAKVPATDAKDDQSLRVGLHQLLADDVALVKATASGNTRAASQAFAKRSSDPNKLVIPALHRLDPGLNVTF
jgi:hypothetical protein